MLFLCLQDLAVRREGTFLLRYRVFDIFSAVTGSPHAPVLAGFYGGPFKVFSTHEFPGLNPSTYLTRVCPCFSLSFWESSRRFNISYSQTLARHGVRFNIRDRRPRKRTKDSDSEEELDCNRDFSTVDVFPSGKLARLVPDTPLKDYLQSDCHSPSPHTIYKLNSLFKDRHAAFFSRISATPAWMTKRCGVGSGMDGVSGAVWWKISCILCSQFSLGFPG